MKEQECRITILPGEQELRAFAGDSLYTLLLVAGLVTADDAASERVCLEKGAVSPAENAAAEEAVFSPAELAEGWMLASERRIVGDATLSLRRAEAEPPQPDDDKPLGSGYGMAFDIGSVTIAAGLVSLDNMRIPLMTACSNAQTGVAIEAPERLAYAKREEGGLARLAELLRGDLGLLAQKLARRAGLRLEQVSAVSVAGSHTMLSLLQARLPEDEPVFAKAACYRAGELALPAFAPDTAVYLLPAASAALGADTVAAAFAADLLHKADDEAVTLLVDLGASGEIVAAGCGRIIGCSVPSLPFEGGGVAAGMPPVTGAITDLHIDDIVTLKTVRDGRPRGLCGAGLIAVVAALRDHEMIDDEGRLTLPEELPPAVASRFRGTAAGREFILSPADKHFPRDICVNQEDILQMQMAKASVFAACQAVLAALSAGAGDVREVLLAESYRANLNTAAVLRLGMLPPLPQQKVRSIGPASWQGAYLALSSRRLLDDLERLAARIEPLALSADQTYAEAFLQAMNFS